MKINYQLKRSNLNKSNSFYAQYIPNKIYNSKNLVKRMINQGSKFSEEEILALMADLKKVVKEILLEGGKIVIDEFISIYPEIEGGFDNQNEQFNDGKHTLQLKAVISHNMTEDVALEASYQNVSNSDSPQNLKPEIYNTKNQYDQIIRDELY